MLWLAIALGTALRLHGIASELQYDEAATGYFAGLPWADLWGGPAVLEPNPPLFNSLARLIVLGGGNVEQIRYLSVAAGVLTISVAWWIGRLLDGRFVAGAAAWLLATSPQSIAISHYARPYAVLSLALLCSVLCIVLARRAVSGRSFNLWYGCYAIASAISLYLHHTAIVAQIAITASALVSTLGGGPSERQFRLRLLAANGAVALAYLPWLPVLIAQAFPHPAGLPVAILRHTSFFQRLLSAAQRPYPFHGLAWLNAWLLPLAVLGAWRLRASRSGVAFALMCAMGPLSLFLASQLRPMLDGKTLASAGLFILIAIAFGLRAAATLRWPALAVLIGLQLWADASQALNQNDFDEGWREIASYLQDHAQAQDTVFINDAGAILALRHYMWPEVKLRLRIIAPVDAEPWFRDAPGTRAVPGELSAAAASGRLWILTYNAPDMHQNYTEAVDRAATLRTHQHAGRLDLSMLSPVSTWPAQ